MMVRRPGPAGTGRGDDRQGRDMDGTGLGDVYRHVFNRSPSEIVNEGLTLRERG